MSAEIVLQPNFDVAALTDGRGRLAAVRAALADREVELADARARLKVFEGRYLRQVGVLYAELDELEARISEREVDLYDSAAARRRAREARERARETHDAAFSGDQEPEEVEPPPSLKTLFREVAKRIHPDFAGDEAEGKYFTLLMMRANQAYSRGDAETLQRLLDDHREVSAADEGAGAALERVLRQIAHSERDIAALDREEEALLGSEIGQLHVEAEAAAGEGRDLLAELEAKLREEIAGAQYRFDFVSRMVERQTGDDGR